MLPSNESGMTTRWLPLSVALVALGVAVFAAVRSPRSHSQQIVLADEHGRPRVRIAATAEGGAVELLDETGRARIALRQKGDALSIAMRRRQAAKNVEFDYAMELSVDEGRSLNILEMRDPATHTVVKLGGTAGGGLTMGSNLGEASLFVSEIGANMGVRFSEKSAGVRLTKHATTVTIDGAPLLLNGGELSLPK